MRLLSRFIRFTLSLAVAATAASAAAARPLVPRGDDRARSATPAPALPSPRAPLFRARGDQFEIRRNGVWQPVLVRGLNLGAAPPGHFPGEFAIGREYYRRWLRFARALHANAIRV